jgi:hypothetical protein
MCIPPDYGEMLLLLDATAVPTVTTSSPLTSMTHQAVLHSTTTVKHLE